MDNETDIHYMSLALSLAGKGRSTVSPNPMVGAVVVKNDTVAGQGYHNKTGDDHAEVIAIRNAGENARGATLYVTLEPCCHYGKTPPCVDTIIKSGIRRVVAAMPDENPAVCGGGCDRLREHKIETVVGVMEDRARKLNETYLKFIKTKIPFVTLKLAATLDGKIADSGGKSQWITGTETRKRVHLLRSWSDAVMVGIGTVLADDPSLTVRDVEGSDPLRVIVDSGLKTPPDAKVLADDKVIIAVTEAADETGLVSTGNRSVEVIIIDSCDGMVSLPGLLRKLGERNITRLLCEGGGILATSLLRERLVDKIVYTMSMKILGSGLPAVGDIGINDLDNAILLKDKEFETVGGDIIITGYPVYS